MKWYIIRHGETDLNKNGIVQGSGIDAPLNDLGLEQAEIFFNGNKHIPFDKVYTSELIRSKQSVEQFTNQLPHTILSGLNEISWGNKEGEKVSLDADSYYMQMISRWKKGELDFGLEGGESPLDVSERQKSAIEAIKNGNGDTILICMHGRAMRILLSQLLETPLNDMDQYEHTNLCLYVVEWDGRKFKLLVRDKSIK